MGASGWLLLALSAGDRSGLPLVGDLFFGVGIGVDFFPGVSFSPGIGCFPRGYLFSQGSDVFPGSIIFQGAVVFPGAGVIFFPGAGVIFFPRGRDHFFPGLSCFPGLGPLPPFVPKPSPWHLAGLGAAVLKGQLCTAGMGPDPARSWKILVGLRQLLPNEIPTADLQEGRAAPIYAGNHETSTGDSCRSSRTETQMFHMWHICLTSWFQTEPAEMVKKGPQCFLLSVHSSHFGQGSPLWALAAQHQAPASCCMSPAQHNAALPEAFRSPCHQEQNRNVLPCGLHR